jgi:hypothetical protein
MTRFLSVVSSSFHDILYARYVPPAFNTYRQDIWIRNQMAGINGHEKKVLL